MADAGERAVRLLLKALGSLSERERDDVLRYLLLRDRPGRPISFGPREMEMHLTEPRIESGAQFDPASRMLPVRLPAELQDRLRNWSTTHGFSMAAVVRGLVERFLDDQERAVG